MRFNIMIVLGLSGIVLIARCKKENHTPVAPIEKMEIGVLLDTTFVPVNKIDSAVLTWELAGRRQQLSITDPDDTLRFPAEKLTAGKGLLTIQLYTRVLRRNFKLQFERRWAATFSPQRSILVPGPANISDPHWMPRVIVEEKEWTKLMIVIGLRPEDPYFLIRNIPARWPQLGISRSYYQKLGGRLLGEKIWMTDGTGQSSIEDRTYFSDLREQLEGKDWNWIDVNADIYSLTDTIVGFSIGYSGPR